MTRLGRWRICNEPGCAIRVQVGIGKCERHRKAARRDASRRRSSAAARGYGSAWRKTRAEFLRLFPVCIDCGGPSVVPDHDPISRVELVLRGDPDPDALHHLKPRCESCHNRKTAIRDGGFGR